jgi:pyruvyl transferase EpsO
VTICVRDNKSLELAKKYFSNNKILLIPDMAFCIDMSKWQSSINKATSTNCLFVKREDKELSSDLSNEIIPDNAIVSDWPTINNNVCKNIIKTGGRLEHFDSIFGTQFKRFFYKIFVDPFFYHFIRPRFVKIAIVFLSKYHTIYTTRLHVSILSVLLEKKNTIILDNSYGKNSAFYETWLSDVDGLELYKKE